MRIQTGIYKGRKLKASRNLSIRPTTSLVKEFIFNVLQDFYFEKIVCDIFSGSGGLGLEALSRGADKIVFVEKNSSSLKILLENIENLGIDTSKYRVLKMDALLFARKTDMCFDLILMDPPFVYPPLQELTEILFENKIIKAGGMAVIEHEITNPLAAQSKFYEIVKQKKFGRSIISFLIPAKEVHDE